jgi:hypothetical protein
MALVAEPEEIANQDVGRSQFEDRYFSLLARSLTDLCYVPHGDEEARRVRWLGLDVPSRGITAIGMERLQNIADCAENAPENGDFVDCGVWRGGSSILMHACDPGRTIWVCDSFEGCPKDGTEDIQVTESQTIEWGDIEWLKVGVNEVRQNFEAYDLLDENVRFLKGWFKDTLAGWDAPIALLRIDCDMASSVMDILPNLYPKVLSGGIVIVDDYMQPWPLQAAVRDYMMTQELVEMLPGDSWNSVYWRKP